jgi:hypothetical protein
MKAHGNRDISAVTNGGIMPKLEITKDELLKSYDWGEVFGEGSGGNCDKQTDTIPDHIDLDATPPNRTDVAEIIAAVNGENDSDEWIGVFRLIDGRFLVASGSCDYTGWNCQAGNSLQVARTLADVLEYGLTKEQRERLAI